MGSAPAGEKLKGPMDGKERTIENGCGVVVMWHCVAQYGLKW